MNFVKQQDERGCCVACVAMLAGVAYETVWDDLRHTLSAEQILTAHVEFWLQYLEDRYGFDCTRDYWELDSLDNLGEIPKGTRYFCAYGLDDSHPKSDPLNTHAFVLDKDGTVFDPAQDEPGALPIEKYRIPPRKLLIVVSAESHSAKALP